MGLSADFKQYLREHAPEAIDAGEVRGDICFLDAMCVVHAFKPDPEGVLKHVDQLASSLWRAAASGSKPGGTVVVCFDRQSSTPQQKERAQKKRRECARTWLPAEVDEMLEHGNLPCGDQWYDFLADRWARSRALARVADAVVEQYRADQWAGVARVIVHNGRVEGGPQVAEGAGELRDCVDAPQFGEADTAMAAWARHLLKEKPDASVVTLSVDTDMVVLMMLHGGPRSSLCLRYHDPKHRVCVSTSALARVARDKYKLSPEEFAVVACSKGTDYARDCIRGMPDWHQRFTLCGAFLRRTAQPLVVDGELALAVLMRMLTTVATGKQRCKVNPLSPDDKANLQFNVRYWVALHDDETTRFGDAAAAPPASESAALATAAPISA